MAQHYDVSLKLLFRLFYGIVARSIFGEPEVEWINIELPEVRNPRVDMVARDAHGQLHHLELESSNDADMPRRVAEYYLGLHRLMNEHVEMTVLYVGSEPLRMPGAFVTPSLDFKYTLIDARSWDGEPLLASEDLGDNMLAILTRIDPERVFDRVEAQLQTLPQSKRDEAAHLFVIISGLRNLEQSVERRLGMIDLMENKVIRRVILNAEAKVLIATLEDSFGPMPEWVSEKLDGVSEEQIMIWAKRVRRADSLESVFA